MPAVPKRQRSKARQRSTRAHGKTVADMPNLITLPSGKRVPRHMVTPENPMHKGVRFIRGEKKK